MKILGLGLATLAVTLVTVGSVAAVSYDAAIAVPEPGTMALLLTGIGVGAAALYRRRK